MVCEETTIQHTIVLSGRLGLKLQEKLLSSISELQQYRDDIVSTHAHSNASPDQAIEKISNESICLSASLDSEFLASVSTPAIEELQVFIDRSFQNVCGLPGNDKVKTLLTPTVHISTPLQPRGKENLVSI
jgi:hypothetical protein